MKKIGILGGMGPETTAKIYLDITTHKKFSRIPKVIISNVALPKNIERKIIFNNLKKSEILLYLKQSIRELNQAEVDYIAFPCNSAHAYSNFIEKNSKAPFINLIKSVSKSLLKYNKIGIIGTSMTTEHKLYDNYLKKTQVIYPQKEDQDKISEIILNLVNCKKNKKDKIYLNNIIESLKKQGAKKILFACTDLSNLVEKDDTIIDSQELFTRAIIDKI